MDAKEVTDLTKQMKSSAGRISRLIRTTLERITLLWQRGVAKLAGKHPFPHYTGAAAASIQRGVSVSSRVNFKGQAFSSIAHIRDLEVGKPIGTKVEFGELFRWVELRDKRGDINVSTDLGNPTKRLGGTLVPRSSNELKDNARKRFAALIQKKILKKGTKGYHVFEKTFNTTMPRVNNEVRRLADRIQRSIVGRG